MPKNNKSNLNNKKRAGENQRTNFFIVGMGGSANSYRITREYSYEY